VLSVDAALERIGAAFEPLGTEWVTLPEAAGRVLAEDLPASRDQPPRDVSAMDGYAVRAADLEPGGARLRVIGAAPAGRAFDGEVGPGETVRIFTGGILPAGADAIALQENATVESDIVTLVGAVAPGRFVRPAGLDVRAGDVVLRAGRRLTPRDVALAASINRVWLPVRRRPRIAVLATGDELVMPGTPLADERIVSSNGLLVAGMVQAFGGTAADLGIVADDPEALAAIAGGLAGFDLVVTLGGASVGDHDLVRSALGERGLELAFWRIAMRPGKPLLFGRIAGVPLLGLPGNPVSTGVCTVVFVRAAIRRMLGLEPSLPYTRAVLGGSLEANDEREEYLRARTRRLADGQLEASPHPRQDSSMLAIFAAADGLIRRAAHAPAMAAGTEVDVLLLEGAGLGV
jgi:molybdopterin molybdotransferase